MCRLPSFDKLSGPNKTQFILFWEPWRVPLCQFIQSVGPFIDRSQLAGLLSVAPPPPLGTCDEPGGADDPVVGGDMADPASGHQGKQMSTGPLYLSPQIPFWNRLCGGPKYLVRYLREVSVQFVQFWLELSGSNIF